MWVHGVSGRGRGSSEQVADEGSRACLLAEPEAGGLGRDPCCYRPSRSGEGSGCLFSLATNSQTPSGWDAKQCHGAHRVPVPEFRLGRGSWARLGACTCPA